MMIIIIIIIIVADCCVFLRGVIVEYFIVGRRMERVGGAGMGTSAGLRWSAPPAEAAGRVCVWGARPDGRAPP